ncbi:alpha/beta hydrolase family protein [Zhongshania sp.]|uniref:alpha/beta hydrolase family protein n=1 Tax=Zhongshania sp. TaxID=1971902 RepID=UPI003567799C
MALQVWNGYPQDDDGNVLLSATVEVRDKSDNSLAAIFADSAGNTPLGNPYTVSDPEGKISFYTEAYKVKITATKDGTTAIFDDEIINIVNDLDNASLETVYSSAKIEGRITENNAFITSEADRAETAADAAAASGNVYDDTTAGLAATVNGDYFSIPSPSSTGYLDLYRNDAGVATFIDTYPNRAAITEIENRVTYSDEIGPTVAAGGATEFNDGVYLQPFPTRRGTLQSISVNIANAGNGTFRLVHARNVSGLYFDAVQEVTLTAVVGTNTFTAGDFGTITLEDGDYLGWRRANTETAVGYNTTGGDGILVNTTVTTGFSARTFTLTANREYMFSAVVQDTNFETSKIDDAFQSRVESLELSATTQATQIECLDGCSALQETLIDTFTIGDFDSSRGLSTHGSGGVVASVGGTQGVGIYKIPYELSTDRIWRVSVAVVVGNDNAFELRIRDGNKATWSGLTLTSVKSGVGISCQAGFSVIFNQIGGASIADGDVVCVTLSCDGAGAISMSVVTDQLDPASISSGLVRTGGFNDTLDYIALVGKAATHQASGAGNYTFGNNGEWIDQIELLSSSTTTRLLGVYIAYDGVGGVEAGSGFPAAMYVNRLEQVPANGTDNLRTNAAVTVLLPALTKKKLLAHHHPNNTSGNFNGDEKRLVLRAFQAGYTVATLTGTQWRAGSIEQDAASSNWAGETGMMYRRDLIDWIRKHSDIEKLAAVGVSMGNLTALTLAWQYSPLKTLAILGYSGVTSIADSYANYEAKIDAGHGDWYVSLSGSNTDAPPSANWQKIGGRFKSIDAQYAVSPYVFTGAYAAGTYNQNEIVVVPFTGTASNLIHRDPLQQPDRYAEIPIRLNHGDADSDIAISQATDFQTAVNAAGGDAEVVTWPGAGHIAAAVFSDDASDFDWLEAHVE